MKNITIYSTPSCHYCHMAKDFFTKHNLIFTDKNIAVDAAAREEAIKKSGQLVTPVIDIDGAIVAGFNEARIRELLDIKQ